LEGGAKMNKIHVILGFFIALLVSLALMPSIGSTISDMTEPSATGTSLTLDNDLNVSNEAWSFNSGLETFERVVVVDTAVNFFTSYDTTDNIALDVNNEITLTSMSVSPDFFTYSEAPANQYQLTVIFFDGTNTYLSQDSLALTIDDFTPGEPMAIEHTFTNETGTAVSCIVKEQFKVETLTDQLETTDYEAETSRFQTDVYIGTLEEGVYQDSMMEPLLWLVPTVIAGALVIFAVSYIRKMD
jgi:hypothetical protein